MNSSFSEQITCNTLSNQREVVSIECWNKYEMCRLVSPLAQIDKNMNNCSSTFMLRVGFNNSRLANMLLSDLNVSAFILIIPWSISACPFNNSSTRMLPVSVELCIGCGCLRLLRLMAVTATTALTR